MKNKTKLTHFFTLLIFVVFSSFSTAGEFTGAGGPMKKLLKEYKLSKEELKDRGLEVMLGEVTGAGMSVPLENLRAVLSEKKVFHIDNLSHIKYVRPSAGKALNDVEAYEFYGKPINIQKVEGYLVEAR